MRVAGLFGKTARTAVPLATRLTVIAPPSSPAAAGVEAGLLAAHINSLLPQHPITTFMDIAILLNSVIYAILGIVIFVTGFIIVDKLTPYDLWKQLVEEKNLALAIVVGAAALGICQIIAAAIH